MNKDIKKLFKELKAQGWYIARESKHLIWRHESYTMQVVTAKTPSDVRAIKNIRKHFKLAMDG